MSDDSEARMLVMQFIQQKEDLSCYEAYKFTQALEEMARSKAEDRYKSLDKEIRDLRWFIVVAVTLSSTIIGLVALFLK
ncbi:MAG: hypothetical protein OXL40_06990 [Bacteroidota bacterium]|nr:hypothetical protein [Bacteroidota bacterium]